MKNENTAPNFGLLLVRIIPFSMLFLMHGFGKLKSAYAYLTQGTEWKFIAGVAELGFPFPAFFAVCAALAETVGSTLLILGLFTRYAAAVVLFNMMVAVYRHAITDQRYELAAMYAVVAAGIILLGPGRFSLDAKRKKPVSA